MKIVKYNNAQDIIIEFQDEYKSKIRTEYKCFKSGGIKNPYHTCVFEIGYIGLGKYKSSENHKHTEVYRYWYNMLQRCYDAYEINKRLTYKDAIVCEEWHNFQNFAKWYEENYYEIEGEKMCLDKDILVKGNKIYSPKTCCFVPQRINTLFIKNDKRRGRYPLGCHYHKRDDVIQVGCSIIENGKKKIKFLGYFNINEIDDAFNTYKTFKENYIKQVALKYKHLIPDKLYRAMCNYKVETND